MKSDPLKENIRYLKGVGEKRAACYEKLGVGDVYSLLRYYPRDYIDYSHPLGIMGAVPGETAVIRAAVFKKMPEQRIRKGLSIFRVFITDGVSDMTVTIFNSRFAAAALKEGESYLFYGKVIGNLMRREMNSPRILKELRGVAMQPVYPLTEGLSGTVISANIAEALTYLTDDRVDYFSGEIRGRFGLCDIITALRNIHFPSSPEAKEEAKRRLVFEELLTLELGMAVLKNGRRQSTSVVVPKPDLSPFLSALPFSLTGAQIRCIEEALSDMSRPVPMNRLLQGDVGSGKTAVAAALAFATVKAGYQSALMAPTDILARQHYESLKSLLEPLGIRMGLLTGSFSAKEKTAARKALSSGETDFVIGTHAIVEDATEFERLGLVITDEQHRFGVAQRSRLAQKGEQPHVLVMSATPIPRTLALIVYGDLDISVLDELPGGRKKIKTYHIGEEKRKDAYSFVAKQLDAGHQAFVVCPLIEESDMVNAISVTEYAEKIKTTLLGGYRVGVLHGKQKPADKQKIMEDFACGRLQVLIATTVVEVGIDVPNATVMLIENAERFGLSQLHQLRGRVGRGNVQSYCILVSGNKGEDNRRRLDAMCASTDGFYIAEQDLKLRGPGDFFGERQHGLPRLKIADMTEDLQVIGETKGLAAEILAADPGLSAPEHHGLKVLVKELFHSAPGFGA